MNYPSHRRFFLALSIFFFIASRTAFASFACQVRLAARDVATSLQTAMGPRIAARSTGVKAEVDFRILGLDLRLRAWLDENDYFQMQALGSDGRVQAELRYDEAAKRLPRRIALALSLNDEQLRCLSEYYPELRAGVGEAQLICGP